MGLHFLCLIMTIYVHKRKNILKKRGVMASLPTKKMKCVSILTMIQLSMHIATFKISSDYDVQYIMQFMQGITNSLTFWMTDVLFFHAGLRCEIKCERSRWKMSVIVLLMFNLLFFYLSGFIGIDIKIVRSIGIWLFSFYLILQILAFVFYQFLDKKAFPWQRWVDFFNGMLMALLYGFEILYHAMMHTHSIRPTDDVATCTWSSANLLKSDLVFLSMVTMWIVMLKRARPIEYYHH